MPNLTRIERLNYLLGGILVIVGALTQPRPIALGLACGVALTCANFAVLRRMVGKWTDDVAAGRSRSSMALVAPKMVVLFGAVAACVLFLPIDIIAFGAGYSLFILSILIEVVMASMRHVPTTNENDHG